MGFHTLRVRLWSSYVSLLNLSVCADLRDRLERQVLSHLPCIFLVLFVCKAYVLQIKHTGTKGVISLNNNRYTKSMSENETELFI